MFGSYPYPRNFYSQNTSEFIAIYVKDGKANGYTTRNKRAKQTYSTRMAYLYKAHLGYRATKCK